MSISMPFILTGPPNTGKTTRVLQYYENLEHPLIYIPLKKLSSPHPQTILDECFGIPKNCDKLDLICKAFKLLAKKGKVPHIVIDDMQVGIAEDKVNRPLDEFLSWLLQMQLDGWVMFKMISNSHTAHFAIRKDRLKETMLPEYPLKEVELYLRTSLDGISDKNVHRILDITGPSICDARAVVDGLRKHEHADDIAVEGSPKITMLSSHVTEELQRLILSDMDRVRPILLGIDKHPEIPKDLFVAVINETVRLLKKSPSVPELEIQRKFREHYIETSVAISFLSQRNIFWRYRGQVMLPSKRWSYTYESIFEETKD